MRIELKQVFDKLEDNTEQCEHEEIWEGCCLSCSKSSVDLYEDMYHTRFIDWE